jgi:hypothetical protein
VQWPVTVLRGEWFGIMVKTRSSTRRSSEVVKLSLDDFITENTNNTVEDFTDRLSDKNDQTQVPREKLGVEGFLGREHREEAWTRLEKSFQAGYLVTGKIIDRTPRGFLVDLNGYRAYLPEPLTDIQSESDYTSFLGSPQQFKILRLDPVSNWLVVAHRTVLKENRSKQSANDKKRKNQLSFDIPQNLVSPFSFNEIQEFARLIYNRSNVIEKGPHGPQEQSQTETSKDLGERQRSLWAKRRDSTADARLTPPEFIKKNYSDLIAQGSLTETVLRQNDPTLYIAYYRWRQRHPNEKLDFSMPKQSEVTEARFRERYGRAGDLVLNVLRQESRERTRRYRQNKATRNK